MAEKIMSKDARYTDDFLIFWKQYPARWNKDTGHCVKRKKRPAFLKWQLLSNEIKIECLTKVKYIKNSEGSTSVRDAVTWLNQYGWEDIELSEQKLNLPPELTANVLKTLPPKESRNAARNRNMDALKSEGKI